ncbi:MAG: phosphate signaling complex protein PhoU [Ruminococcus sp.]|nr:phosphate signaling complex protein PhoU [Ruminococcus sp.]
MSTSVRKHFDSQLRELNERMLKMASETENSIKVTIKALTNKDTSQLDSVVQSDALIDKLERQIEGKCLKLLLQQQPVAKDLRTISSALKIITDLERIADQSVDIGEIILKLPFDEEFNSDIKLNEIVYTIQLMANSAVRMVEESIVAYTENDVEKADMIIDADDCIDDYFVQIRDEIIKYIVTNNKQSLSELCVDLLTIIKYLEKIGDHAVNIAEWVKFDVTGIHKNEKII